MFPGKNFSEKIGTDGIKNGLFRFRAAVAEGDTPRLPRIALQDKDIIERRRTQGETSECVRIQLRQIPDLEFDAEVFRIRQKGRPLRRSSGCSR